jgi:hypothetical protein
MAYGTDDAALASLFSTGAGSAYSLPSGSLQGTDLNSAFTQYQPGGGDWWDRNFGMNSGASSGDLAKALQGASKGLGTPAGTGAPPMAPAPGVGPSGSPRAPSSLDQLVRLLQQRREALLNSATGVGQAAQPLPAARATGLLGF